MKKLFLLHIIFITGCLFVSNIAICQKGKNKYVTREVKKSNFDTIAVKKSEFQFDFKNINKIPYYYNAEELAIIKKHEHSTKLQCLFPTRSELCTSSTILRRSSSCPASGSRIDSRMTGSSALASASITTFTS